MNNVSNSTIVKKPIIYSSQEEGNRNFLAGFFLSFILFNGIAMTATLLYLPSKEAVSSPLSLSTLVWSFLELFVSVALLFMIAIENPPMFIIFVLPILAISYFWKRRKAFARGILAEVILALTLGYLLLIISAIGIIE